MKIYILLFKVPFIWLIRISLGFLFLAERLQRFIEYLSNTDSFIKFQKNIELKSQLHPPTIPFLWNGHVPDKCQSDENHMSNIKMGARISHVMAKTQWLPKWAWSEVIKFREMERKTTWSEMVAWDWRSFILLSSCHQTLSGISHVSHCLVISQSFWGLTEGKGHERVHYGWDSDLGTMDWVILGPTECCVLIS